jgi:glucose/arabinose dehydrogenase
MIKKRMLVFSTGYLLLLYFIACDSGAASGKGISGDSATIAKGEVSFNKNCSGCHNFRQDGIGPKLSGLTEQVSADWIHQFIKNPKQAINDRDKRAEQLYNKYKVVMPSFETLSDNEMDEIIAFLNTQKLPDKKVAKENKKGLADPIPEKIESSNLVVGLGLVTQIPRSSDTGKLPLTRITKLDFQPNTAASFILDLRGKLYKLQNGQPVVYMDMARLKPKFINEPGLATGFGSFAFHPQFAKNGLLYTTHTEPAGTAKADFSYPDSIKKTLQWVLTEWKAYNPNAATFSGTGRELLRADVVSGIHGVQEITFNTHAKPGNEDYGLLYIGIGDGGCVENGYPFLTHSPEKIWGTILRINPAGRNSANGKYGIPPDNPFAKSRNSKALGEIYAYGFRNPHRITWSKTGQMLACNIGHSNIESINLIAKGHDYGWPIREGAFVLDPYGELDKINPLPTNDNVYHITYPVAEYDHDEGKAISGGFEYTGKAIPQLKGKYLFGDIPTGRLFYVKMADIKQGRQAPIKEWKISINGTLKTLHEMCGNDRVDLHLGKDSHGELYILTKADGRVYKLISATAKQQGLQKFNN